jgi:hypothetical protein
VVEIVCVSAGDRMFMHFKGHCLSLVMIYDVVILFRIHTRIFYLSADGPFPAVDVTQC